MTTGASAPPPPPPPPPPAPPPSPPAVRARPRWLFPAGAVAGAGVIAVVAIVAATSGGSSTSTPTSSTLATGVHSGQYVGQGQNIQRITFTVDGHSVTGMHGTYAVSCASTGGSSYQTQTFVDPDHIAIGTDGTFNDNYRFGAAGGVEATLTVAGRVTGGVAVGHLQFAEPYCGTPLDGWAAALPGQALPPVPSYTPPDTTRCDPQPCSVLGGVVLHINAINVVSKSGDPSTQGVAVDFTVTNTSSKPVSVSDGNMRLTPDGGTALYSSYAQWVDASGAQVDCLHGTAPQVPAGQSAAHLFACFAPPANLIGQLLTLTWQLTGSGSATFSIGAAH